MADRPEVGTYSSSGPKLATGPSQTWYVDNESKGNPKDPNKGVQDVQDEGFEEGSTSSVKEVFDIQAIDPVLAKKMALANEAIDAIGMTSFQWKLFFLNGFGYAVDSLLIVCQSIASPAVQQEYGLPSAHIVGIPLASQVGLLVGAGVWGFSADIIGRKLAFNTSLFGCSIFVLIAGGMPDYISFAAIVAIYSACAGGNYILDATNFLEFLPTTHAWLVTFMAIWWAVGYTITGLLAWAFMSNYSCAPDATTATCPRSENMGWRYLHLTCGALVLVMALLRVTVINMTQTPRWLLSNNRDEEVISVLNRIAAMKNVVNPLSLDQLQSEGIVLHTEKSAWSRVRMKLHFQGLFQTRKLAWSTTVIIANWFVIGMVTPLFSVFLPYYLKSRGADTGDDSNYTTWRNYAINQISGVFGPIIAGILVEFNHIGRRGALAIGAAITMILQFGYTQIKTPAQNVGVSAAITAAS
ncbi:MAG: hypothetical protein Q9157_001330 [Trypethelium eluteriae]